MASEAAGLLSQPIGKAAQPGNRSLTFLPLVHILARSVTYTIAQGGATVGFWDDFKTIVDKFGTFQPDVSLGVPHVFEKVHAGIRAKARGGGSAKAAVFDRAERVAIAWSGAHVSGVQRGGRRAHRHAEGEAARRDQAVPEQIEQLYAH